MRTRWWFVFVLALGLVSSHPGIIYANPIPVGACCLWGGECRVLPEQDCYQQGGFPLENVWSCEPNPCWGACCTEFGSCIVTDYVNCVAPMGVFLGSGSTCADDPCGLGACCLQNGSCVVLHPDDCAAQGGEFTDEGYPCSLQPCSTEDVGTLNPALGFACTAVPNPFTSETVVTMAWSGAPSEAASFEGVILDAAGRLVRALAPASVEAGRFVCRWDGRDDAGQSVPAGVYFLRVRCAERAGSAVLLRLR